MRSFESSSSPFFVFLFTLLSTAALSAHFLFFYGFFFTELYLHVKDTTNRFEIFL
jgi:hypothetical protein